MEETEAELRGRLVMLETLLGATIARIAEISADPARTIAAIMVNAEELLTQARDRAGEDDARAAEYALAAFDQISDAMQRHVAKVAPAAGRG